MDPKLIPYKGKRVLVTGGAGFIGAHIVEALVLEGADVVILDQYAGPLSDRGLKWGNVQKHWEQLHGKSAQSPSIYDGVDYYCGDITSHDVCFDAAKDCDIIFHLAALVSVPDSINNPVAYARINTQGTLNILDAARKNGVSRVVYSATSAAYGDGPGLPKVETMPIAPQSPYAVTKTMGEAFCRMYSELYGLSTISLRYFNVFGARQNPNSAYAAVIPKFLDSIAKGEQPKIYGDGEQTRDFCHISNIVHANLLAGNLENSYSPNGLMGQTVNICCGKGITVNELFAACAKYAKSSITPIHMAERKGDIKHSIGDYRAAEMLIGYKPITDFETGMAMTVGSYINGQV